MRFGRVGLIAAAVTFARSAKGQELIAQARQKLDTPQNRAKVQDTINGLRQGKGRGQQYR